MRDSSDSIGVVIEDRERIPMELKTRVAIGRIIKANDIKKCIAQRLGVQYSEMSNQALYVEIDASCSGDVNTFLPDKDERFQNLHHVFTNIAKRAIHAVGNHTHPIYGVIISFSDELLNAYGEVMDYLFDHYIKQFYGTDDDLPDEDLIEAILDSDVFKKKKVDYDSFMTYICIWKKLNVDRDPSLKFPLPACSRVIPIQQATWNVIKHLSESV